MRIAISPFRALALLLAALGALSLIAACGSTSAGEIQPSAITAGQSPIDTYSDTESGSVAAPDAATPAASGGSHASDGATSAELARVRLVSVEIGADGHYIAVHFKAPPRLARTWQPGMLSVVDERTRRVYDDVPNVPVLGPLLGKPKVEGQTGYVMLLNSPPLAVGDKVTVVLGSFKKAHVHIR